MKNIKKSALLTLMLAGTCALTGCDLFKKKTKDDSIVFWSSFGATYTNALNTIVNKAKENTGVKITHVSQNNYDNIKTVLMSAINVWKSVPDIAMGYPDHFAEYLGNDALVSLDDYVTGDLKSDYIGDYLDENYFWVNGQKKLFGVPFNKSTEVLGYNGTFVAYCKYICDNSLTIGDRAFSPGDDLGTVPQTWQEWEVKGPKYMVVYDYLIDNKYVLYGKQAVDGSCSDFVAKTKVSNAGADGELHDGDRIGLLDFSSYTPEKKAKTRLMSWDATDNAFITLIKQWGAKYTELPTSEHSKHPFYQEGHVVFSNSTNLPKVIDCLKFFNNLSKKRIFGVPAELNSLYSSDAFAEGSVMFMVCSSGGLSYNTKTWHNDFTVAPIPYYSANGTSVKEVISQGANICMLDTGHEADAFKVMKDLTTGDTQVEWCMNTGYYPCSITASNAKKYTDFIHEADDEKITEYVQQWNTANPGNTITEDERRQEVYSKPARVAYRQGSYINEEYYMKSTSGWHKFTDVAFYGSSGVRKAVKDVFKVVFREISQSDIDNSSKYQRVIKDTVESSDITTYDNVKVETAW